MADFDTSQLDQLSADLGNAPKNAGPNIYKAFTVTSARIKTDWQRKLTGMPHVPLGRATITYDIESSVKGPLGSVLSALGIEHLSGGNQIVSDIGAEDGRPQATIVAVEEYGSPINNLPPHGYGTAALQDNQDDFSNGLLLAIGDPLAHEPDRSKPATVGQIDKAGGVV